MRKPFRFVVTFFVLGSLALFSGDVRAGEPIGAKFLIYDDVSVSEALPSVAYNSQDREYLVVWEAESAGPVYEVWGRRVSVNGTPLGSAFRISPENQGSNPDVAYSSATNEYLVVWEHDTGVVGRSISATGTFQGNATSYSTGEGGDVCDQPAVAYGPGADRYLLAFRHYDVSEASAAIRTMSIQSDGEVDVYSFVVRDYSATLLPEQPDVAYNPSRNEFLTVWQQTWAVGDRDIHGRRVGMSGGASALGSPFSIMASTTDDIAPAVTAIPTVPDEGQYLVTWQTDQDIRAQTVAGDETLGTQRTLANTGWGEYRPAAAGCESSQQFLVVWTWVPVITPPPVMQVQGRRLDLDGAPLHDTVLVGGGQVFDVALATGPACGRLIAFDDNATFGSFTRGIYGQMWGSRVFLPLVLRQ